MLARGLAKEPQYRFAVRADFVHALRDALDRAAGTTSIGAVAPARPTPTAAPVPARGTRRAPARGRRRGRPPRGGDEEPQTAIETVKETVTLEGTTIVQTVTTAPEPQTRRPTTAPTPTTAPEPRREPAQLNDHGFALMQAGDYEAALPLLEPAVAGLRAPARSAEAYASYNLAFTRLALGRATASRLARPLGGGAGEAEGDHAPAQGGRAQLRRRGASVCEPRGVLLLVVLAVLARLDRLPPAAVGEVPGDRLGDALVERLVRRPAELRRAWPCRASSGGRGRRGPRRGGSATRRRR